ncbi:MAG: DUF4438 domain-containing protein [Streptosporangiaceae bacterium]
MITVNLLGVTEHSALGESPYRVDRDGLPYVPVGDGGIVLGLELGDSVFRLEADHAAPGACLVHPDPAARHALATFACIGNSVQVRTGAAAGATGAVIGKRGEEGRVIVGLPQAQLALLRPSDELLVRTRGQGWRPAGMSAEVAVLNLDPAAAAVLPIEVSPRGALAVGVRAVLPGKLVGNGIGRPAASWDLDLQITEPPSAGADATGSQLLLGDLLAITDLDARFNMGYRRGWLTVGVVVHGASPLPGHGPGLVPIFSGPGSAIQADPDSAGHAGLTLESVQLQ